jgi:hypothetical protein
MALTFSEALAALRSPACGVCRYRFGPAGFDDEDGYDRLGTQFTEAVAALTETDGPPLDPGPTFPGMDIERAVCWRRGERAAYVALSWEDNTRCRFLTLGLARRGEVIAGVWGDGD